MPTRVGRPDRFIAPALLASLFLAASIPLILFHKSNSRAASDQNLFHLPVIRQFERELPHPDLRDYPSATTPGYHLAVAAVARMAGTTDERFLRFIGMSFTLELLAAVALFAGNRVPPVVAISVSLPVLASPYIFSSGVWLLPDNAGWLFILWGMMLALRDRVDGRFYLGAATICLALVWIRQSDAWIALPFCTAAIVQTRDAGIKQGLKRLALVACALLPALASLVYFSLLWHGLVPPNQRHLVSGGNASAAAAMLACVGIEGAFFLGFLPRHLLSARGVMIAAIGAVGGFLVAFVPPTTYDSAAGRYSGIWNLVPHFPILFGRSSVVMIVAAAAGGAILLLWLATLPPRRRAIWASAIIAFALAQMANHNAYYRYYEPAVLIAAVAAASSSSVRPPRWALIGPLLLAAILARILYGSI